MSEFSDFSLGKKKDNVKVNLDEIKGGIKAEALDKELYSIFNKSVNTDENEILDKEEIDNFINEIKAYAKDNNFSLGEAAKYLKEKNLKDINPEKLYSFISNLFQASENILESSVITANDGNKTFFIKYKDTSEETIYPDKTSKIEFKGLENELITKNIDASGKKISEIIQYEDKSKRTTVYEEELPKEETYEKDGTITTITYEKGSKKAKSVKTGETIQNFEYINGQEKLVYSKRFEDKKQIEETNTYNADGRITHSVVSESFLNSSDKNITTTDYEYHDNGKLSKTNEDELEIRSHGSFRDVIIRTFDEEGKRLHLTKSRTYHFNKSEPSTYTSEMTFDKNGNIVGYVPKNSTLDSILKDLGIEKDSDLYNKFMELNRDSIKIYRNGKVTGFDVGAKIIIPGEVEDKALRYFDTNPEEERESYVRENLGNADIQAIPTTSIKIEKDTTWWELAKQNLIDLGNPNPTKAQIAENMNLLVTLNHPWNINNPVTAGTSVAVRVKESAEIPKIFQIGTYNIENLRKNYPSDKYQIKRERVNDETNEWGGEIPPVWAYHIYDKSNQKEVLSVTPSVNDYGESGDIKATYFDNGKISRELIFTKYNDNVTEYVYRNGIKYHSEYEKGKQISLEYTDPKTKKIVSIGNPSSPDKVITIKSDEMTIDETRYYKNGKLFVVEKGHESIHYDNTGSYAYSISWNAGYKHLEIRYPKLKDFCRSLRNGNTAEAKKIMDTIDKDNYKMFLLTYTQNYKQDLIKEIQDSGIDDSVKNQMIKKIRDLTNEEFKITVKHRVTQSPNGGDKYSIDLNGDILTVKNQRTGKVSKINFNELLSECSEFEKAKLKKVLAEQMPGNVLEDLSVEIRKLKVQPKYDDDYEYEDFKTAGTYHSNNDYIYIDASMLYGLAEDGMDRWISKWISDDMLNENIIEILTHEIGHSIDYNGYIFNTASSSGGKFYEAFKREMEEYKKAGKVPYNKNDKNFKYERDTRFNQETGEIESDSNTVYATSSEREMFAECYTLIMLGDCQSKDHILKYFPETFKAAQELLKEIRQKSDNERQNRFHV